MGLAAPTVLLGWELGGGLGHVQQLIRLARALAEEGCAPVLALKDLVEPECLLRALPYPVLQAPTFPARLASAPFLAGSYADILAVKGYANPDDLLALVRGWQGLIDVVRPAVVVADHSPTLCLAAYGVVPTVVLGNGFIVPPMSSATFPPMQPGRPAMVPQERLLEVVHEVQRRRGRPAPATLPGLLAAADRFVLALPELDPYHDVRNEPALGTIETLPSPLAPPASARFFAYLNGEMPGTGPILTTLARSGIPGRAYVRRASEAMRTQIGTMGLEVLTEPLPQDELLRESSVIVHHASLGLARAALAAGRPQLAFPANLEHLLTATRLHALGVAHYLTGQLPIDRVNEALRQLVNEPRFPPAREVAADIQARGPWEPLPAIVACCRQHAGGT